MKTALSIALLFYAGLTLASQAQTAPAASPSPSDVPLPPGPLLAKPDFAAWELVTARRTDEPAAQNPASPKPGAGTKTTSTLTVTKTGKVSMEVFTDAEGKRATKWSVDGAAVYQVPGSAPMLLAPETHPVDFPELAWVNAKNFSGIEKVAGIDCLVFRDKLSILSAAELRDARAIAKSLKQEFDEAAFLEPVLACINLETRLPVVGSHGKETYTYRFLPTPDHVLAIPPTVESLVKLESQRQKDLTRRPARS